MGISCRKSCSSSPYATKDSNPNPLRYYILSEKRIGNYLILEVRFPDCTNFEGRKILVFKGWETSAKLLKLTYGRLDPHFQNICLSPIARFAPTFDGMQAAISFCKGAKDAKLDSELV